MMLIPDQSPDSPPSTAPESVNAQHNSPSMPDVPSSPDYRPISTGPCEKSLPFAVLLNDNAKKVTARVKRSLAEIVPRGSLYVSRTSEEAGQFVREIIDQGCDKIFSGGGDGSLVQLITAVRHYVDEKNRQLSAALSYDNTQTEPKKITYPSLGILKLGTGNAMAHLVGARQGLKHIRQTLEATFQRTIEVGLIESENTYFTFSGLGWDAAIINDYDRYKEIFQRMSIQRVAGGLTAYLAAIGTRTIPRELVRRKPPQVRIRCSKGPVFQAIQPGTLRQLDIGPGDVIYDGPANIAGVGTVPYYGFRLKAFPFAQLREGMMNVRIVRAGVMECLSHAWTIWTGTYASPNFLDFLVPAVSMEFSELMPLHIGGDPCGYRSTISYELAEPRLKIIAPLPPGSRS